MTSQEVTSQKETGKDLILVEESSISKLFLPHQKQLIEWLKSLNNLSSATPAPNDIIDLDERGKKND